MKVCRNCGNEFKQIVVIDGKQRNLAKRAYCLECSPFGRHNRKILESGYVDGKKPCGRCKKVKSFGEFYKKGDWYSCYCVPCSGLESKERQWKFKTLCVKYKGGKCIKCGYNKSIAALDFHHRDCNNKEFSISSVRFWTFNEKIKNELDKCDLLCANCHRELHHSPPLECEG